MRYWLIPLAVVVFIVLFVLALSYAIFLKIFYASRQKPKVVEEYPIPPGDVYRPHREQMIKWIDEVRSMEHTDVSIKSHDGLCLTGRYYEYKKGAPTEILFHGYRGTAERDLCGGVYRCFNIGHNALIVDHRAAGGSEGHVISFGANESLDCARWVNFVISNIDRDAKIILTGISMGAATVMTAAGRELPENVIGILADCGYTSAREIIRKVIREMKLPDGIFYPFVKLGARIFGGFDLEETSPIEAVSKTNIPIIFVHGDNDDFVPYDMSVRLHEACASEKKALITIPGAGHGLAYPVDKDGYVNKLLKINEDWNLN